jgi:hypothetical protein
VDVEGLLELGEQVLVGRLGQLFGVRRDLPRAGPQPVDAEPSRELGDPGPDRLVLAERVEPLVDPREDLLEDVLGVVLGEPERLDRDRVDIAREPLDERVPGFLVAAAAKRDEFGVAELGGQRCWASRSRFASVSSSFQAMEAFDSTSGRNSQEVRP